MTLFENSSETLHEISKIILSRNNDPTRKPDLIVLQEENKENLNNCIFEFPDVPNEYLC